MPDNCPAEWLDSPNGKDYAADGMKTTSITWAEMVDNDDPMAQPVVPYVWPNAGSGVYPGYEMLYGDVESKDIDGTYTMSDVEYVSVATPSSAFVVSGSLTVTMIMMIGIIAF